MYLCFYLHNLSEMFLFYVFSAAYSQVRHVSLSATPMHNLAGDQVMKFP